MSQKVLFIPLDDRPCCLEMVERIAALADSRLITPPREDLGHFQSPGNPTRILDWLEQQEGDIPLICSIDMVTWGGLIASRHPDSDALQAREHFDRFCRIEAARSGRSLVFKTLLRTAPTQTTPEEVEQAEQIVALSRMSFLYEKNRMSPQGRAIQAAIDKLKDGISPHVLELLRRDVGLQRQWSERWEPRWQIAVAAQAWR